jgi:hypothetical protein
LNAPSVGVLLRGEEGWRSCLSSNYLAATLITDFANLVSFLSVSDSSVKVSDAEGLIGIAEIAEWERWTFEYLPDGSVRFSKL